MSILMQCLVLTILLLSFLYLVLSSSLLLLFSFFFFNDTATTEIYTLSLHDALPILGRGGVRGGRLRRCDVGAADVAPDRKSTRLNSSHSQISYAVFCLKKKKKRKNSMLTRNK